MSFERSGTGLATLATFIVAVLLFTSSLEAAGGAEDASFSKIDDAVPAADIVEAMMRSFNDGGESSDRPYRHPSFIPRLDSKRLARVPELETEIPLDTDADSHFEDSQHLIDSWLQRPNSRDLLERFEQAAAVPTEDLSRSSVSYSGFTPIGNGIKNPSRAHRTGRASQVQWAYDHSQSLTTMYVAGTNGGLWKYVLSLGKWVPLSDNLNGSPAVGAFWVDPNNSKHLLIGTGDPWRNAGSGLYESTDGGSTWTLENLGQIPSSFYKIASDRSNPSIILAASRLGLWRSTNGGGSWQQIINSEVTDVVQDPVYHSYWYAAGQNIGIQESSNHGASFHTFATGFPTGVSRISLAVCDAAPNHVYAIASSSSDIRVMKGIYRSTNYGYTWQAIKTVDDLSWGQAFHTTAIAVDPTDPNRLLVGMGGFQMNLSAAGPSAPNSWIVGIEIGHADCTSFAFTPDGRFALASNDGGVYSFDTVNQTWVDHLNLIPDLNLQEIIVDGFGTPKGSFHAARQVSWMALAGLQDNGVVRLDTGANTVDYLTAGDGGEVNISNHDYYDLQATSGGPPFSRVRSTDFGVSWSGVDCGLSSIPGPFTILEDPVLRWPYRTFTHQGQTVYWATLDSSCVWKPVNNVSLPAGFTSRHLEIATRSTATVIYVNGTGASFSDDVYVLDGTVHGPIGQMSYAQRTPNLPAGSQRSDAKVTADRHASKPDTVYYTTGNSRPSRAFVSQNRGITWKDVTGNLTSLLPNASYWEVVALPTDPDTLFLATDVGIFNSVDGGQTWIRLTAWLPRVLNVTDIEVQSSTSGQADLLIATKGRGFYRTTIY